MNMRAFIPLAALIAIFNTPLLLAGNVPGPAVPVTPVQPAASAPPPAAQPAQTSRNVTPEAVPQRDITWLGIAPGHVPQALFDQLKQIIPPGQGVLVKNVIPDSPAARAGIRTNDVLLAYGNQKLYSAQQLAGLVRADRPESTVAIQVVQQGQLKTLNVVLGKHTLPASMPAYPPFHWRAPMMMPYRQMPNWPHMTTGKSDSGKPSAWSEFESVQVRTLPNGRYHAEVVYKDEGNNSKKFSFEGTQQEIRSQIQKDAALPQDKKQALLEALNMNPATLFYPPMFEENPFNDSFFQDSPFDEDFFRGFPPMHVPPGFPSFFQPSANGGRGNSRDSVF